MIGMTRSSCPISHPRTAVPSTQRRACRALMTDKKSIFALMHFAADNSKTHLEDRGPCVRNSKSLRKTLVVQIFIFDARLPPNRNNRNSDGTAVLRVEFQTISQISCPVSSHLYLDPESPIGASDRLAGPRSHGMIDFAHMHLPVIQIGSIDDRSRVLPSGSPVSQRMSASLHGVSGTAVPGRKNRSRVRAQTA